MNDVRFSTRGWVAAALLLTLAWTATAIAQPADAPADDPLAGDDALGGEPETPPTEGAPPEGAPPEGAPPEGAPPEGAPPEGAPPEGAPPEGAPPEGATPPPMGDTEPAPAPKPASEESGDMIVTGSRIKRSNYAQPSAVAVVDRKQLQMSGADNLADVVRYMNINYGSEINADIGSGSPGTAQFNLRGLGLNSTLVLLNGRRLVQSAALATDGNNYIDINTLPMQMIERVEVLKGGASAIYGSDAVAGVVNVITRRKFDGFEAQAGAQTTDDFDQHEWDVSLLGGAKSDSSRVSGLITYFRRDPLYADDRDFTNNGKNTSDIGWPGAYLRVDAVGRPVDPDRVPDPMMPMGMPLSDGALTAGLQDPGCGMDMRGLSTPTMTPISATAPIPFCRFNFNSYYMLVLDEERVNTFATVEHDIGDHTMVFFEGGYARSHTHRILSPSFAILQPIFIPADHMYNPTGSRLRVYGRLLGGNSPPLDQYYTSDTLHTVAGISGDFGGLTESKFGEWEWELAGTWSMNRFTNTLPDNINAPLQDALNQCGPTGDPARCLNPFFSGAPNSKSVLDRVTSDLTTEGNVELTTAGVDLTGPIVELPGGDLSLALGAQMRHETATAELDYNSNQLQYTFLVGGPDWQAERQIMAAYGELALPFFEGFEMQAAGRFENYDDVGSSTNPMAGISWTPAKTFMGAEAPPISMVRVRGTYATSFRAPSLLQTNGAQTALVRLFDTGPDPMNPAVGLRPTSATFRPVTTLGNADLEPQTSTAITGGIEWTPAKGLLIQGDYWNYNYEKIIVKEEPQNLIDQDFAARNPMNPLGNPAVRRDANSRVIELVETKFINASSATTHGIDVELGYRSDFGATAGTFSFGATGSYVLSYEIPINQFPVALRTPPAMGSTTGANWQGCSGDTCDVAGLRNLNNFARPIPKLRVTVPLSWNLDAHTVAVIGNFIGGFQDDETIIANAFPDVDPFFTVDLQYSLRIDEGDALATTIKVGVLNIADSDPPYIEVPLGYDSQTHDPRGRMIYGRLIQEL